MKVRKRITRTVDVNVMEGITAKIYQGVNKTWYWHISQAKGEPELLKNQGSFDTNGEYYWYDGHASVRAQAERGLATLAGRLYVARLKTKGYLTEKRQPEGEIEF